MRLTVFMLLLAAGAAHADEHAGRSAWQYVDVVDGVHVWSAEDPDAYWGHARGTVEAPAPAVFARVSDFERLPGRYPFLDAARVIERTGGSALVYFHYDLPWPLSDREHTAAHRWWTDGSGTIALVADDVGAAAVRDGDAVPIEGFKVRMTFAPVRAGAATEVDYLFRADFGGSLPRSVRRQTAWKIPLNAILAMRRSIGAPGGAAPGSGGAVARAP